MRHVVVIGGGPAGLMAAEVLATAGVQVDVYEAMPTVGRKFLRAGVGGLNLTHAESPEKFITRYRDRQAQLEPLLAQCNADTLRTWAESLGVETFVGSSGRVFPTNMKAAPLLRRWLQRLRASDVRLHTRHRWLGWQEHNNNGELIFATATGNIHVQADAVVLALGGASWSRLGSDGAWVPLLTSRDVEIAPWQPANCGFDVQWSEFLRTRFAGAPVKPVAMTYTDSSGEEIRQQGEFIVTETGIEGGLVYALSANLRDQINASGSALIHLDLVPGKTSKQLLAALSVPRGKQSMASHLRKRVGIDGIKAALLHELLPADSFTNPALLAGAIKALPLRLRASRPLDEAISVAGGLCFAALDEHLMLRNIPGVFCAGEMLDWEAPTGGYLLTGCFATGRAAGAGVLHWLESST